MRGPRREIEECGALDVEPLETSLTRFIPALAAASYPFILRVFHALVGPPNSHTTTPQVLGAAALLIIIFSVPTLGLVYAAIPRQSVSSRRLAYASVTVPTAYVFLGVIQSMLESSVPDEVVWCLLWLGATIAAEIGRSTARVFAPSPNLARWRVAHGFAGAIILIYVLFHLANHLFGLIGPEAHAAVMNIGRSAYRAPLIEPLLVLALLFQICSGLNLAWRWSAVTPDFYRLLQIASGCYLSVFILGHMNSVFFYARTYLGIPTDWAFATGAPNGLIHDPWNIRLLPHYALGVFFVLTHITSGLRLVLIAHGVHQPVANRLWAAGAAGSAMITICIIAGLCGVRLP